MTSVDVAPGVEDNRCTLACVHCIDRLERPVPTSTEHKKCEFFRAGADLGRARVTERKRDCLTREFQGTADLEGKF